MAINSTAFTKTPQAGDDSFVFGEDQIVANIITLDVMSNDLGGNAKQLWSLDDGVDANGNPVPASALYDALKTSDVGKTWETTAQGNLVRIVDGKVQFDVSHSLASFGGNAQSLGAGESIDDSFTYAIRLANGTLSWATVRVTINGSNDGPDASDDAFAVTENQSTIFNVLANDSDIDLNDTLTISGIDAGAYAANFTTDGATIGFDPGTTFDHLAVGQSEQVTVSYTVSDGNGGFDTASMVVTVNGTNDGPVAVADTGSAGENEAATFDVLTNDSDVDDGDVLGITAVDNALFTTDGTDISFNPGTAFDYLAEGETASTTVNYTISDGNGGTATAALVVTVNGVNDGPDAVADVGSLDENDAKTFDVLANDTDVDASDILVITALDNASFSTDGALINFHAGAAYDYLAAGESAEVTVNYTISDGHGGTDTAALVVTVNGVNDGPDAVGETGSAGENETKVFDVLSNDTDADASDTLVLTGIGAGLYGSNFSIVDNKIVFTPGVTFDGLNLGQSQSIDVNYSISDGNGGTDSAVLHLTINGENDVVAITVPTPDNTAPDLNDFDNRIDGVAENGTSGSDTIQGTIGNDVVITGNNGDDVIYGGAGNDQINGNNNDDLLYGGSGNDFVLGSNNADTLFGGSGADSLNGGSGNDVIHGGTGADTVTGGSGADQFVFLTLADTGDRITDFTAADADRLNISALDANAGVLGNQAFAFSASGAAANSVWFTSDIATSTVTVYLDNDGNLATAELSFTLAGVTSITAGDFIL